MSSYPKPRYSVPIFVYDNNSNRRPTTSVVVPGPAPQDTSITEEKMNRIALYTNYNSLFSSYPWLPSPNIQPSTLYILWNDLIYGEDYLEDLGSSYAWRDSMEYIITGTDSPYKITGPSIDVPATTLVPRGLQPNNTLTLTRPSKPFLVAFTGTVTDTCITFTVSNFKLELMSDYSVKYYLDNVEVARSVPLCSASSQINYLGFSNGIVVGDSKVQDTTGVKSHARQDVGSDVTYITESSVAMPSIVKTGSATWTFKAGITIYGFNMYESMTLDNIVYEGYLLYDSCRVRTVPPTWL